MPLSRSATSSTKKRERHECIPIHGEHGRYTVKSASAAKKGHDEAYIVDIFEREPTNAGEVLGTCGCKGWSVRKTCSHLVDARAKHDELSAEAMGFTKYED